MKTVILIRLLWRRTKNGVFFMFVNCFELPMGISAQWVCCKCHDVLGITGSNDSASDLRVYS